MLFLVTIFYLAIISPMNFGMLVGLLLEGHNLQAFWIFWRLLLKWNKIFAETDEFSVLNENMRFVD